MKIQLSASEKKPVTRGMIGLFIEDINYALDGGLYAEMLENRNFEAKDAIGERDHYTVKEDGGYAWAPYPNEADVYLKIKTDRALFPENPHYMRITANQPLSGMQNKAYDGLYLGKGKRYKLSFYARSYDYKGGVLVGAYKAGESIFEGKVKLKADGKWHRYSLNFKSKFDCARATFAVRLIKAGMVHMDCFSLMPENAVLGIFRRDLVERMKALKPGFLRFPGGCVVEGNTLANRYLWKNSIGQVERRKHNWNRWAVHGAIKENDFRTPFSHYGQTLGIGYFEYFRLCEFLGAKPLPVVSVGLACQYMSTERVPLASEEFDGYVQDALDVVEFARGGTDTVWGRVRAEMGHPEPFALEYLGVGNEQWEADGNEFYKRFEVFERRLHEKYPDLKIIGTAGPTVCTESYDSAWAWTRERLAENPDFVFATDEHFYASPEWLYEHADLYDNYPREGKVYAGEYAAHLPSAGSGQFNAPASNLWEGALAEAAFMTGMERNADVVVMASYAPLFARLGYAQWSPDLIWFDGERNYATASYYVQQLYSLCTGDHTLKVAGAEGKVYASATEREGMIFLKVVNAGAEEVPVEIEGDFDFGALTRIVQLAGELSDCNTLEEPERICPRDVAPKETRAALLPPHSFSVLVFMK